MAEITIKATDGSEEFFAYVAYPAKTPAPAIIVIQEIFGVNKELRDKCDDLAKQGYVAIAPDLFWRIEPRIELVDSIPEQLQRAFKLFSEFDVDKGMEDLKATLKAARAMKECDGKVGCVGYCLGGKLAYTMAARTDIDASVGYYGVGLQNMLGEAKNIKKPLLLHIAAEDQFVPPPAQKQIVETFEKHPNVSTYSYPGADHAFARGNGMHYNEQAATLANQRTRDFFKQNLG